MMTVEDIEQAQQAWGNGIVAIAAAHRDGEDFAARAHAHVETLYAYGLSEVLFKPTL
ncbi:MAG: phosphoribosyl-AMP cyclohydrolase, partial [Euryarchaeota archaeon]